jgi:hypothetical protein
VVAGLIGAGLGFALGVAAIVAADALLPFDPIGYGTSSTAAAAEPGQCFATPDLAGVAADAIPCGGTHVVEVFARRPVLADEDAGYPIAEDLGFLADSACMVEFEPYVGRSYGDSSLDFEVYVPSASAWAAGERDVVCALFSWTDDTSRGSAHGSGR